MIPNRSTGSTSGAATGSTTDSTASFCGHCGAPSDVGDLPASDVHQRCGDHLAMEPPRYCNACRRRMKVQVTPLGWSAECSRHGMLAP